MVQIGFPIMIKATAGGGGRGMRLAKHEGEYLSLLRAATQEAQAAFGNGAVYLERYVQNPRHIEFQVLCDKHGNAIHLGERDCSIQRRNQKLLEEAPSPALTPEVSRLPAQLWLAPCGSSDPCEALCTTPGAQGHGRCGCERGKVNWLHWCRHNRVPVGKDRLLFHGNEHSDPGELSVTCPAFALLSPICSLTAIWLRIPGWLQVEHPVTEMITGVDLIQEQIRAAQGHKLRYSQADIKIKVSSAFQLLITSAAGLRHTCTWQTLKCGRGTQSSAASMRRTPSRISGPGLVASLVIWHPAAPMCAWTATYILTTW